MATNSLALALLEVQKEAPKIQKDADGQIQNRTYKYLTLEKLMEVVLPVLNKHGLVWITLPGRDHTNHPALTYRLVHAMTGDSVEGAIPLMVRDGTPQEQGSAITYARRYALMAVLGVVADEDDDGAAAQAAAKSSPKTPAKTQEPLPTPTEDQETVLRDLVAELSTELKAHETIWGQVQAWAKERGFDLDDLPSDKLRPVEKALRKKVDALRTAQAKVEAQTAGGEK